MSDWLKLYRSIGKSDLWLSEPFTRGQAWVDLLVLANWKPGSIRIRGTKVPLDRGQIGHAERYYCERWQWSRGKVRRFLGELETEQQIVQQKTNVTTVITIVNYEEYQGTSTADSTANGPQTVQQTVQQTDQNKEETIITKKDKKRGGRGFTPPTLEQVRDYCNERNNGIDPQHFLDYYGTQGWKKSNGQPVKDWKGCVRTWEKHNRQRNPIGPGQRHEPGSERAGVQEGW